MKKKKKGSSLLLVLVVFSIISILGVSVLGVTMNDYKMRIEENKKAQGLYNSEAGLDVSVNIMAKMVEVAIEKGNEEAEKVSISDDSEQLLYDEKNSKFKETFIKFLSEPIGEVSAIDEVADKGKLKYCLENAVWIDAKGTETKLEYNSNFNNEPKIEATVDSSAARGAVEGDDNNRFVVNIISQFDDGEKLDRQIEAVYDIRIPEYQSVAKTVSSHPILNNLFSIHGNAYLSGNLTIDGDVFVGGENQAEVESGDYDVAYNKYDNGIRISDTKDGQLASNISSAIDIKGSLITPKSLYSGTNATIKVSGDIYAGNVYLGKKSSSDSTASNIELKPYNNEKFNMYLSNDLALNADSSSIELDNFYGLSDINHVIKENSKERQDRVSSSIIINSKLANENILTINENAYILGTAYIKTKNSYQTGESIAVKGNYIAYTSSNGNDELEFVYDDPLQLIDKLKDDALTVFDKAKHIEDYAATTTGATEIQTDGIKLLGNVVSIGAYINEDGKIVVNENNPSGDTDSTGFIETITSGVEEQRKDFVDKALSLGISDSTNYIEDFYKGIPRKTVAGGDDTRQINFGKIDSIGVNEDSSIVVDEVRAKVVLNNNANKKVIIIGEGGNNPQVSEHIVINLNDASRTSKTNLSGLIITAGDVEVYGEVNFNGTIISGGDFVCNFDNNEKTFTKNLGLVQKLIAEYADELSGVINENATTESNKVVVTLETANQYNVNNYIENKLWKILK